jgi:hypothetical protein
MAVVRLCRSHFFLFATILNLNLLACSRKLSYLATAQSWRKSLLLQTLT